MRRRLERSMRRAAAVVGLLGLLAAPTSFAEKPVFSLSADVVNRYVWRGLLQNDEPAVQPSFTASWLGFSANVWGSIDTTDYGDGRYNDRQWRPEEVDYTLSYTHACGPVSLSGGVIAYTFPGTVWASTQEVYGTVALTEVPLTPTLSAYYDVDEAQGLYVTGSVGKSFDLVKDKLSLALGASIGASSARSNAFYYGVDRAAFADVGASATLKYSVTPAFAISPYLKLSEILDHGLREALDDGPGSFQAVVGVNVTYTF